MMYDFWPKWACGNMGSLLPIGRNLKKDLSSLSVDEILMLLGYGRSTYSLLEYPLACWCLATPPKQQVSVYDANSTIKMISVGCRIPTRPHEMSLWECWQPMS